MDEAHIVASRPDGGIIIQVLADIGCDHFSTNPFSIHEIVISPGGHSVAGSVLLDELCRKSYYDPGIEAFVAPYGNWLIRL